MDSTIRRKPGAQPGNQNARSHGFYARALCPRERRRYYQAQKVKGLDQEIALFQAKLHSLLSQEELNISLILDIIKTLRLLIRVNKLCQYPS